MPHHVFTRSDLYHRVWARPVRTVAGELGISGVGLGKACRIAGIPVPPRGYWTGRTNPEPARSRPSLPARPSHQNQVVIAPAVRRPTLCDDARATAREQIDLAPIAVPRTLRHAHPLVRALVADALARRRVPRPPRPNPSPVIDLRQPLVQRRLRLTSALLTALETAGLTVSADPQGWRVQGGPEALVFDLYERSRIERRPGSPTERRWRTPGSQVQTRVPVGDLVVIIRARLSVPTRFHELNTPLDDQLARVVTSLVAGLEELREQSRRRAMALERAEAAETQRKRRDAFAAAQDACRDRLLEQADRYRRAQDLRAYIEAADRSPLSAREGFANWQAWAKSQADRLDPLVNDGETLGLPEAFEVWDARVE